VHAFAAVVDLDVVPAVALARHRGGDLGSACASASSVASENTTPKPKVSSARLRS
jgi:hypothetical protein